MQRIKVTQNAGVESADEMVGQQCLAVFHVLGIGFNPSQIRVMLSDGWVAEDCFRVIDKQIKQNLPIFAEVKEIKFFSIDKL